ncbi:hypothetical protein ASC61_04795 [Aeromicrobium sp. Root344]|uniref:hypothetical protein n=1 Tax=Aeromicrobium sp. Root344 TaxID=1736521 RepID=UPI0006FDE55D|nr:hypothetical protein [Aeromicrobium sp. Root344]KQV74373.1 hypothetical protein ASC61_04795 [Aeromicrobium sp. Root344]
MSDLVFIDRDASPWDPSATSELVFELDRYNFPRTGILRQRDLGNDLLVLFDCIAGEEDKQNLWIYATIDSEEAERLASATGTALLAEVQSAFKHRWVTLAYADDFKVQTFDRFDAGSEGYMSLMKRYILRLKADLQRMQNDLDVMARHSRADEDELTFQ